MPKSMYKKKPRSIVGGATEHMRRKNPGVKSVMGGVNEHRKKLKGSKFVGKRPKGLSSIFPPATSMRKKMKKK